MNKADLVEGVAQDLGVTKTKATQAVESVLGRIQGAVANRERVNLVNFGAFEVRHRQAKKIRNPQDGTDLTVPAKDVPAFKPGKGFKDAVVNG